MENKGQASAEYLLIVVVILIIISAVTIPLVGNSISSTMDISKSSDTKNAIESIANAVNLVYANGPGARRTVSIYIPLNMNLTGNNTPVIGMIVPLSGNSTKSISAATHFNVTFSDANFSKNWHKVTVNWPVGSRSIVITHQVQ